MLPPFIAAPAAVVVASLICASAAGIAVFSQRPHVPTDDPDAVQKFFWLEIGDGVLDIICTAPIVEPVRRVHHLDVFAAATFAG